MQKRIDNEICPYLGLRLDPGTAFSYPSIDNYCFHGKINQAISLDHQEGYCLSGKFPECNVFASGPGIPLPISSYIPPQMRKNRKLRGKQVVISLLFLGFLLFAAWAIITSLDTSRKLSTFPTGGIGTVGTALSSPTFMLSPTGTETSTDIATDTPILSLGLEEPIGLNKIFILHNVISGESLEFIARRYGTTVESLVRCNYELPSPLLPGIVIVVPVNYVVDDEFPPFNVYEVLVKTSPETLAEKLNVDLADFMYYNDFTSGIFLYPGNWVLIPQSAKSVP